MSGSIISRFRFHSYTQVITMFVRLSTAALALAMTFPTLSLAGDGPQQAVTVTTPVARNDTTLFAGLNWTFGAQGQGVEGVLGIASGEIDLDGDVTGGKLSFHFGFGDGVSFDKVKLTLVVGEDDVQAEVGGGYSLRAGAPFAVIGANGEYFNAGADIFFDGTLEGYLGLHTIGSLSLDSVTTTTFINEKPQIMVTTPGQG